VKHSNKSSEDFLVKNFKIVGKSQKLEKCFLRLTCLPDPLTVRPKHILQKSLTFVMNKYLEGKQDHNYILGNF
jgi:hypothetical protein